MADSDTGALAERAVRAYMAAFNARDSNGMAATFHFPHVRLAKSRFVTIESREDYVSAQPRITQMLSDEGWDHTIVESLAVIQAGADKVHIAMNITRRDATGSVIHHFDTMWIVTLREGAWGVQFRSSFLLSDASTLGPA